MSRYTVSPSFFLSQRKLRVGELVRRALSEVLTRGEIKDQPLNDCVISVTEVRMSSDLKIATVFVMPLGGVNQVEVLEMLKKNSRWLRALVTRKVDLKFSPSIRFKIDTRFEDADRIAEILRTDRQVK